MDRCEIDRILWFDCGDWEAIKHVPTLIQAEYMIEDIVIYIVGLTGTQREQDAFTYLSRILLSLFFPGEFTPSAIPFPAITR
jgi:hypothetical protein